MIFDNELTRVIVSENVCIEVNSPHLRKEQTIILNIRWFIVNISLLYRITFCKQSFLCFIIYVSGYKCFADITFEQRKIGIYFEYIVQKNHLLVLVSFKLSFNRNTSCNLLLS